MERQMLYLIPYIISILLSLGISAYSWNHRNVAGARWLTLATLGEAIWTLQYIFELVNIDLSAKLLWDNLQLIGMFLGAGAWLAFAIDYTGQKLRSPKQVALLLSLLPLVALVLVFSNSLHGWAREDAYIVAGEPFSELLYDYTLLDWLMFAYSYALIIVSLALLFRKFNKPSDLYRRQVGLVTFGLLIPIVGTIPSLAGIELLGQRDWTPFIFALSNLVIALALFRYRLLDVVPLARDLLIESMREPVIVLDTQYRIIDLNPAAQSLLQEPPRRLVGQSIKSIIKHRANLPDSWIDAPGSIETSFTSIDGTNCDLELTFEAIYDAHRQIKGWLIVAKDVTLRKQAVETMRASERLANATLDALSANLAIVNHDGTIVAVNKSWRDFAADNGGVIEKLSVGTNYLNVCDNASGVDINSAQEFASGLRAVLEGEITQFEMEYPCHSPKEERWFVGRVTRFAETAPPLVAVSHENITNRKRSEEAEHRQRILSDALRENADLLNSTLNLDELLDRILDSAERVAGHQAANIALIEGDEIHIVKQRGYERWGLEEMILAVRRRVAESPELGQMIRTRKPLVISDILVREDIDPNFKPAIRSYAGIPITADNHVIGFLNLNSEIRDFFTTELTDYLGTFALQIASAFRNVRLYEHSQERNRQLILLNQITRIGTTTLDFNELLDHLTEMAAEIFRGDICYITLWDSVARRDILGRAKSALPPDFIESLASMPPNARSLTQSVLEYGAPLVIEDIRNTPHMSHQLAERFPARSVMVLPLQAGKREIGALVIGFQAPHVFATEDILWAQQAAELIGLALDRAQTYSDLQKQRDFAQHVLTTMGQGIAIIDQNLCFEYLNPACTQMLGYDHGELEGRELASIVMLPDDHAILEAIQQRQTGLAEVYETQFRRKDDSQLHVLITATPRLQGESFMGSIVVITDLTQRIQMEQLEREQRIFAEALRDITTALNSTLELDAVLDLILDQLARVISFDAASLMLVSDHFAYVTRVRGYPEVLTVALVSIKFAIETTPYLLRMQESGKSVVLSDSQFDALFDYHPGVSLHAYCGVPIQREGQVLGFLNLEGKTPGMFTSQHAEHLAVFAEVAAIAIQNARLYQQAQQMAILEERQRLARDLHDAVSQTLFSASVLAEMLPRLYHKNPEVIPERLAQIHRLIRGAMAEMRTLLFELRPTALNEADLNMLLQNLVDAVGGRTTINTSLSITGEYALPLPVKIALYRVAQEAINNSESVA